MLSSISWSFLSPHICLPVDTIERSGVQNFPLLAAALNIIVAKHFFAKHVAFLVENTGR